jgi:hypothetical protein
LGQNISDLFAVLKQQQGQFCYLKLRAQQEVKDRPVGQPSSSSKIYMVSELQGKLLADFWSIQWADFCGAKIRSVGCFWTASFQSKTTRKIRFESASVFMPIGKIYTWLAASFFTLETSVFEADFSCSELFRFCLGRVYQF